MDTLLAIILGAFVLALVIRALLPAPRRPMVIYVPVEPAPARGAGCLPFIILLGVALVVVMSLITR